MGQNGHAMHAVRAVMFRFKEVSVDANCMHVGSSSANSSNSFSIVSL